MINRNKSVQTAIAIGVAMENACASGDLEAAECLFEEYRHLFEGCTGRIRRKSGCFRTKMPRSMASRARFVLH